MQDYHTFKDGLEFRPKYKWPRKDAKQNCPKCNEPLPAVLRVNVMLRRMVQTYHEQERARQRVRLVMT